MPFDLVDQVALVGPDDRVRDRLSMWRETCITTIVVAGGVDTLRRLVSVIG